MAELEKMAFMGWNNCYRFSNGVVDLIFTTDIGPRILRFGYINDHNHLKVIESQTGFTGGSQWRMVGGHRFWHAPEMAGRTAYPDNEPVTLEQHGDWLRLISPIETSTGIEKEIDIHLAADSAHVALVHRLRNHNLWTVELAPWAITVMADSGKVIVPLNPRGTHPENLLPTDRLILWAYTNMADPRWTWGTEYILLCQDPSLDNPQKIGIGNQQNWVAYASGGQLFVKQILVQPSAHYPDFGALIETYTRGDIIETETLAPLTQVEPGATAQHTENWHLFREVPVPNNDADVNTHIMPKVQSIRSFY